MNESDLKHRLRDFALRTLRLCEALPNTPAGRALANQLIRSGTSPGTNYRAACRGRSRADFIAKLAIAEEEIDESNYWLDLIITANLLPTARVVPLYEESAALTKILSASRYTATLNNRKTVPLTTNQKSKTKNKK